MRHFINILSLLLLFSVVGCNRSGQADSINVAVNLPMDGPLAYFGEQFSRSMDFAEEQFRDTLAAIGVSINIDYADNKADNEIAIQKFYQQKRANPDIYISGVTPVTMALLPMVKSAGYIHHVMSFTPLYLKEEDSLFRTWLNLGIEANKYIDVVLQRQCKKVAYLYVETEGARQQCEDIVIPEIRKNDPSCTVKSFPYPVESSDLKNTVLKVKDFAPDFIIINGFDNHLTNIIENLYRYNMAKDNNIIGSFDMLDAAPHLSAEMLENITMSAPTFLVAGMSPKYEAWKAEFMNRYHVEPTYTDAYTFDYYHMLVEAARIIKKDGCSLRDALYEVDVEGVTGRLKFQKNGDLEIPITLCKFQNGMLVSVE